MKRSYLPLLCTILFILMLGCTYSTVFARGEEYTSFFEISIEPHAPLQENVPNTFDISVVSNTDKVKKKDATIIATVYLHGDLRNPIHEESFQAAFNSKLSCSGQFQITIPDNEIIHLMITVTSNGITQQGHRFIDATEDEWKFLLSSPVKLSPSVTNRSRKSNDKNRNNDIKADTLTAAQLSLQFDIVIQIKSPEDKEAVQKLVGPLPESSIVDINRGLYRLKTSLKNVLEFEKLGIKGEGVKPGKPLDKESSKGTGKPIGESIHPNPTSQIPEMSD